MESKTVYLPEDEYNNFLKWKRVEDEKMAIERKREIERSKGEFNDYPDFDVNPYLNDLLKKTFRKVEKLNLIGRTMFLKQAPGTEYTYEDYDHSEEIGGELYA
jgi:hypothetical protein